MGSVTRKKTLAVLALSAMIGLILLPVVAALPALASGGEAPAAGGPPPDAAKKEGAAESEKKVEKARDVYYKTEGIVSGAPAPKTTD
ncbi:MAG: hypothetical protein EPO64_03060, partial [Nitrospirae bacterium]